MDIEKYEQALDDFKKEQDNSRAITSQATRKLQDSPKQDSHYEEMRNVMINDQIESIQFARKFRNICITTTGVSLLGAGAIHLARHSLFLGGKILPLVAEVVFAYTGICIAALNLFLVIPFLKREKLALKRMQQLPYHENEDSKQKIYALRREQLN